MIPAFLAPTLYPGRSLGLERMNEPRIVDPGMDNYPFIKIKLDTLLLAD
jgi:hypothetical protein